MTACNTVDQCLRAGEARLTAVSETPRLDAEVLLAHALNWPRSRLYAYPEHTLAPDQRRQWQQRLNKRLAGIPVAYLCEHAEFWSLPLRVTPATLIPRPETEGLVEWALALGPSGAERRVADLGTGSGAIALALAKERSDWQFTAVDISTEALNVARHNAVQLGLSSHIHFIQGHWCQPLVGQAWDLIVSNPPYVADADPHLAALHHEPATALCAGPDGLRCIRSIVADAFHCLTANGWLLLEHGWDQGPAVRKLLSSAGYVDVETRRDLAGHERTSAGRRPET